MAFFWPYLTALAVTMSSVLLPMVIVPACTSGVTLLFPLLPLLPLFSLQLVLIRAKPQKSIKLRNTFFMTIMILMI